MPVFVAYVPAAMLATLLLFCVCRPWSRIAVWFYRQGPIKVGVFFFAVQVVLLAIGLLVGVAP